MLAFALAGLLVQYCSLLLLYCGQINDDDDDDKFVYSTLRKMELWLLGDLSENSNYTDL